MSRAEGFRVPGFRAAGVRCGIKTRGLDLALIASDEPASIAGVFTRSTVVGAPVEWCREHVRAGRARAVVVNSGISNVAMGDVGRRDAAAMAKQVGRALEVPSDQVFMASTGVIGERLPIAKVKRGIDLAASCLDEDGFGDAAHAILTTDTHAKLAHTRVRVGGRSVSVAGFAKGSGMIEPNMATMLGFVVSDMAASPVFLRRLLRAAADESFNRVTVDGETSTSDMVLMLANGRAGNTALRSASSPGARAFAAALREVSTELARALARDGEGATRLVDVQVTGAKNAAEAERAARRIANSMLVKTAIFGGDPNWGRILQTVGAGRVAIQLSRARVRLAGVEVFRRGASAGPAARKRAEKAMGREEVEVAVHLGVGRARDRVWTCDLTNDYIRINAEYTT